MAPGQTQLDIVAARAAINLINQVNIRTAEVDEIKLLLEPLFTGYLVSAPVLNPGVPLFRARIVASQPAHRHELLYPPPEYARLNRANRPGHPLLYCSSSRDATFAELRPVQGDMLVLSEWRTTAPLLVNHIGFSKSNFEALGSVRNGPYWSDVGEGQSAENAEVAGTLATLFSAPVGSAESERYKVTAAVAEKLLNSEMFNGLLYPSIATKANCDNLAIKPPFVDASVEFVRAECAQIQAVDAHDWKVEFIDSAGALGEDGRILWRGRPGQWVLRGEGATLTLTAENGRWVARDRSGEIVEPE